MFDAVQSTCQTYQRKNPPWIQHSLKDLEQFCRVLWTFNQSLLRILVFKVFPHDSWGFYTMTSEFRLFSHTNLLTEQLWTTILEFLSPVNGVLIPNSSSETVHWHDNMLSIWVLHKMPTSNRGQHTGGELAALNCLKVQLSPY